MTATERAWQLLAQVADPELPIVSVVDLGIVRSVTATKDQVDVVITPTYSGCPALAVIEKDVREALERAFARVDVQRQLSPPWTTDWITSAGREKLSAGGIAPPPGRASLPLSVAEPPCPRCGSESVERLAEFGSTACKSLWRCLACREPFDAVKVH